MQSPLLVVYILLPLLLASTIVRVCVVAVVIAAAAVVYVNGVAVVPNELCSCFVLIDHYCVSSIAGKLQLSEK